MAYKEANHSTITSVGIDETSSEKGHDYLTVAMDMDTRRVVHVTPSKGAETITSIAEYLSGKGCDRQAIQLVCIDLLPSFIIGVTKEFGQAGITFDRYHDKALLNKAKEEVRKREYRLHAELKGHKYLFLKSNRNLSELQRKDRNDLLELLPTIRKAFRRKLLFDDFGICKMRRKHKGFYPICTTLLRN